MGNEEQDKTEGTPVDNANDGGNNSQDSNDGVRSYTQEQLNEMFADRAKRAKQSVYKDLGIDDMNELKTIIETYNKAEEEKRIAEEAKKTEIEKLREQLKTKQSEAERYQSQWQQTVIENDIWKEALSHDVPNQNIKALIKLANVASAKIENGIVIGSKEIVEKTLEENPFLKLTQPTEEDEKPKAPGTPVHNRFNMPSVSKPKPKPEMNKFKL